MTLESIERKHRHKLEREYRRQEAVRQAVQEADRIILAASDGSVEETDFLTAEVARAFVSKVCIALESKLLAKEFKEKALG